MLSLKKFILVLVVILLVAMTISGCDRSKEQGKVIYIADQYGLAYAPVQIMKEQKFLEQQLGDEYTIKWVQLANTAAIREAMLAEDLDIGFLGIPPFLIGVDQDMGWKIMSGLAISPLGLVAIDDEIQTLEDLIDYGQIALPQPGSIQHILLSMAAEEQLGDAKLFDHQLISMKHPDGYQALSINEDVKAHFTSPPYLFQELELEGSHLIVDGEEAMGEAFTFIVGVCREGFKEDEELYYAFVQALDQAISYVNYYPDKTVQTLSEIYEMEPDILEDYLYNTGIIFTEEVKGIERFTSFMKSQGYIDGDYVMEDIIWD